MSLLEYAWDCAKRESNVMGGGKVKLLERNFLIWSLAQVSLDVPLYGGLSFFTHNLDCHDFVAIIKWAYLIDYDLLSWKSGQTKWHSMSSNRQKPITKTNYPLAFRVRVRDWFLNKIKHQSPLMISIHNSKDILVYQTDCSNHHEFRLDLMMHCWAKLL